MLNIVETYIIPAKWQQYQPRLVHIQIYSVYYPVTKVITITQSSGELTLTKWLWPSAISTSLGETGGLFRRHDAFRLAESQGMSGRAGQLIGMIFPWTSTGNPGFPDGFPLQKRGVQMELDESNESYLGDHILVLRFMVDA